MYLLLFQVILLGRLVETINYHQESGAKANSKAFAFSRTSSEANYNFSLFVFVEFQNNTAIFVLLTKVSLFIFKKAESKFTVQFYYQKCKNSSLYNKEVFAV